MLLTLFLGGDVMTGRGVDQILAQPSPPELHEPFVTDARDYVQLAEAASGVVPRGADPAYIWGDALAEWERIAPDVRIANLETSITRSSDFDQHKDIHYRMHPANVGCIQAARLDVCALANNHALDYGHAGLLETLQTLETAGIRAAGAGRTLDEAGQPVVVPLPGRRRVLVAACAHESSGVRQDWAALPGRPGIGRLPDLDDRTASALASRITAGKRAGDVAVVSIHWGGNWGYDVPSVHVRFARRLVDEGVDIVHGHSSHHVRPIELYRDRLILYGCGELIDDYEGISGYEQFRSDLVLMFFPTVEAAMGRLIKLQMTPMRIRRLSLARASSEETAWLNGTLNRISGRFDTVVDLGPDGTLTLLPGGISGGSPGYGGGQRLR